MFYGRFNREINAILIYESICRERWVLFLFLLQYSPLTWFIKKAPRKAPAEMLILRGIEGIFYKKGACFGTTPQKRRQNIFDCETPEPLVNTAFSVGSAVRCGKDRRKKAPALSPA
jgi:hypothetical protein